jgi:hypothetical protein
LGVLINPAQQLLLELPAVLVASSWTGTRNTKAKIMVAPSAELSSDSREHTKNIRQMLDDLITHARGDIEKIDDPQAKVLFETTAEVLIGLKTAFQHYESKSESAFRSH